MDISTETQDVEPSSKRIKTKTTILDRFRKLNRSKKQILQLSALLFLTITAVAGGSAIKDFVARIFINAGGENAQININAPISTTTGASFAANIVINPDLSLVSGVDIAINFPKDSLVLDSITPITDANTLTTFTPITIENTFDVNKVIVGANSTGVIKFGALAEYMAGMSWSNQQPVSGPATIARLMFHSLKPGTVTLTVQKTGIPATDSHIWKESDGHDILSSVTNATINIVSPTPTPAPTATPSPTSPPPPIGDREPPSVVITEPAVTSLTAGTKITIKVAASDNVKVAKVVINVDGKDICTDTSVPFSCIWRTTKRLIGPHTIAATAFDTASNTSQSIKTVTLVK